jgi:hypothetical protein
MFVVLLDDFSNRLFFYPDKKIISLKEHTKISKIAKFGCEML